MLIMEHVSYGYKNKKKKIEKMIIEDMSWEFKPGVLYCIYGESGVGKTTLLSLLGGLESPTTGKILLDGTDIKEVGYNTLRRKYVTYIFQDYHLFPYMTGIENVMVAMEENKKNKKVQKEKAIELLEALGIEKSEMERKVTKLSGGQKQRVAIARALATNAQYILADEPTGNLDTKNTDNIISILKELVQKENKCVIVVTHSNKVKKQSDICIDLDKGDE